MSWYAVLCCAQGKPTMVYPGEQCGFPRSWFVLERTRTAGEHGETHAKHCWDLIPAKPRVDGIMGAWVVCLVGSPRSICIPCSGPVRCATWGALRETPDKLLLLQLAALAALSSLHSLSSGMPAGLSVTPCNG